MMKGGRSAWLAIALSGLVASGAGVRLGHAEATVPALEHPPADTFDYQYRMVGKVRLLFFWVGNDDVGSARVTRTDNGSGGHTIALLIGSDPARAPRKINEWGYVREQVRGGSADIFGVRSLTEADSPEQAEEATADPSRAARFAAICSEVTPEEESASVTSVRVDRDVTYHQFARLLDGVEASTAWAHHRVGLPTGTQPGFLTALQSLLARNGGRATYVYKEAIYDLSRLSVKRVSPDLARAEYLIRKRGSQEDTEFTITYGLKGDLSGAPVQATFQPNWWFKVELHLDAPLDLPEEPSKNPATANRIDDICGRALADARAH